MELPTKWTTQDGRTLNIKEMETDHLVNVLKHIEKVIKRRKEDAIYEEWAELPTYQAVSNELKAREVLSTLGD
jgi:hypothetical protein